MAKLTAWLITIVGILLILPLIGIDIGATLNSWIIALAVLVVGIGKLVRNYSKKRR
jgi:general stress protein CsbA